MRPSGRAGLCSADGCAALCKFLGPHGQPLFQGPTYGSTQPGWWARFPDALVGVPTGSASGLVVIDVDPDGIDFLLGPYGELLETGRRHKTPRGFHYLFRAPTDRSIRSSISKLAKGVDVRGDGGYIIWWPAHGGTT